MTMRAEILADRQATLAVIDTYLDGLRMRERRARESDLYGCDLVHVIRAIEDQRALFTDLKRWIQDAWKGRSAADARHRRAAR